MNNYIALIRRADFIDLYKYGSIHVNKDMIQKFSCKVNNLRNNLSVFTKLTMYANSFESSFSYLFIHYAKDKTDGRSNDVRICDVKHIYPLDNEAKIEFSQSFDKRIKIENPLWPDAVLGLQKKQTIEECLNGADNIWRIYALEFNKSDVEKYISTDVITEVVNGLYANKRPLGELPIWVYAMRYERHSYYPKSTIGCFMDTIHVIFNYMQKQELQSEAIENTQIMLFLQKLHEEENNMPFEKTLNNLITEPSVTKIIEYTKSLEPEIDLLKTLVLYFIFKNRYIENFRYEQNWHETGIKNGFEFAVAAYMLGCTLQHEHTYDCLYEKLPLPIFKVEKEISITTGDTANDILLESRLNSNSVSEDDFKSDLFESERKEETILPEPKMMKKNANGKVVYAQTEEQYIQYLDNGYKEYKPQKKNNKKRK